MWGTQRASSTCERKQCKKLKACMKDKMRAGFGKEALSVWPFSLRHENVLLPTITTSLVTTIMHMHLYTSGCRPVCFWLWLSWKKYLCWQTCVENFQSKYLCEVLIPSLLSDSEPVQMRGSWLRWLLLAHFVPVPADCGCRRADWPWSPLHGSSEQGLHHPICPDDPPFETGRTGGIEERRVREREKRGKGGHSSLV